MNWTAIPTISELASAVVVIVTLWYVAVQIRQNTKATLANSRQGLIDSELGLLSDYIDHAIDPHFIGDDAKLSPEDERRFTWIVGSSRCSWIGWRRPASLRPHRRRHRARLSAVPLVPTTTLKTVRAMPRPASRHPAFTANEEIR